MANREKPQDSAPGERKGDLARAERLKAALRENLKRRKAQAKKRIKERTKAHAGGRGETGAAATHDSAGFVPDKSRR
jgi:hypothetical protein